MQIVGLTGLLGVLLIAITQMRINTVNLYLASTNLQSFFSRVFRLTLPRTFWVVAACVAGYLLMLTNVFSYVLDALNYQGIAIVAWVGVALGARRVPAPPRRAARRRWSSGPAASRPSIPAGSRRGSSATARRRDPEDHRHDREPVLRNLGPAADVRDRVRGIHPRHDGGEARTGSRWRGPYDPLDEVEDPWEVRVRCHRCDKSYVAQEMDRDPTADHQAICAACATGPAFYAAARHEAHDAAEAAPAAVPAGRANP